MNTTAQEAITMSDFEFSFDDEIIDTLKQSMEILSSFNVDIRKRSLEELEQSLVNDEILTLIFGS